MTPPPTDESRPAFTKHPLDMTEEERSALASRGIAALREELGPLDAIRFFQMYGDSAGRDYTRDRWRWLGGESNDELLTGAAELLHELGQHELADRVAAFAPAAKAAEEAAWAKEESGDLEGVADRTTAKEAARDAGRAKAAEIAEANRAAAA